MRSVHRFVVVLAIVAATLVAAAAPSSAAVSAHMEVTKVPQGQLAYARGQTDPGQKIVFVQRWNGSRWYDITGAVVHADGTFRAALRPKDRGIYTFRVRSKSGGSISGKFYLNVTGPVLFHRSGEGSVVTAPFRVTRTYIDAWSVDCTNTASGYGEYELSMHADEFVSTLADSADDLAHITSGVGRGLGSDRPVYLTITTPCRWSITIWAS